MRTHILVLSLVCAASCRRTPSPYPSDSQGDAVFTLYSTLSRNEEVARRTMTPLTFAHGQAALAARGQALAEQAIDLTQERFSLYVPEGKPPPRGYGLFVFVSPGAEAPRPRRWRPPLDRHHLIFVSAARSGNDANMLERRVPLALLAVENVRAKYPIDPDRIYVGGLSGGARASQIIAMAYPDVFRGVLLNAGSEPIGGERGMYLPPADLFQRFQRTRIVFVTGSEDTGNLEDDQISQASLKEWCVFDVDVQIAPRLGHEALDPAALDRALDSLDQRRTVDEGELAQCNAKVQAELSAKLDDAAAAIARGDKGGGRDKLRSIDGRYAGLSAPRTLELDAKLR